MLLPFHKTIKTSLIFVQMMLAVVETMCVVAEYVGVCDYLYRK